MKSREESGRQIVVTADGSHTLFVPLINEHYHSLFGAIQESTHIFIQAGFKQVGQQNIRVLEVGFGTGLNALLTSLEARKSGKKVEYTSCEPYPLVKEEWTHLNFRQLLSDKETTHDFSSIHEAKWDIAVEIHPQFSIHKVGSGIEEMKLQNDVFNLVFYDAFSPEVQPEMWKTLIFEQIFGSMSRGGILVTYCCKGSVKRALKSAGFSVEKLPGPPGKREILRASKPCL